MKRQLAVILMGVIVSSAAVYAHCGHCEGDKPKTETKPAVSCPGAAALEKLNLTDDQKAKIADLQKECAKATSKSECREKCSAGLEKILTADQLKEWKSACGAGAKSCPMGGDKGCSKK